MVRYTRRRGPLPSNLELVSGQGHPEHVDLCHLVHEQRHPAPAAADVEHPLARLEVELGGDMRFLVGLRLLKAVPRIGEIGTAVLLVVVEEEFVELVLEVVMVRDVLSCALCASGCA